MKFIFVDKNEDWVTSIQMLLRNRNDCQFTIGDVKEKLDSDTAFVTASNCLLFADSGLDRVYSRELFPGSEKSLKNMLNRIGRENLVGKPYLPIGDALMLDVTSNTNLTNLKKTLRNVFLTSCPTMLLPFKFFEISPRVDISSNF